ncbi:MAG TPA: MFS transporter [Acidimicrobiales bacterium]|nr:MFS transporter [Acidimicrobiales bacterium]
MVFLFVILAAQLMVVLDGTIVNVALPHIKTALDFTPADLSWVLNAYVLSFGGLMLLGARSGDLLGRRRALLFGIGVFSVGSMLGGLAGTATELLAARALQGAGAAFAAPSSLGLLTAAYPDGRQRVRAIGLFTTVSAAGAALGLIAGGVLTQWLSWRWVMFVNVPIGLVTLALGRAVLKETPRRRGRLDIAGALTSTAGVSGIVLGLVEAGTAGWASTLTIGPLAAGALLLGLFAVFEKRAPEPVLPLRLMADLTRTSANVARGLVYAGMYGVFFFMSQFLQEVQGDSALRTGLYFLPVPISVFLSSQVAGRLLNRGTRPKTVMLGGTTVALVALALSAGLGPHASALRVLANLVLFGIGMGVSLVSLTTASLAGVEPRDAGAASGVVNVVQQLGAAVGLAALVTVYSATTGPRPGRPRPAAAAASVLEMVHGLHAVFLSGAIFAAAAIALVALGIRLPRAVPVPAPGVALVDLSEAGDDAFAYSAAGAAHQ